MEKTMTQAQALHAARELFGRAARVWRVHYPHCRPPKWRYYVGERLRGGEIVSRGAGDSWQAAYEDALVASEVAPGPWR